MSDKWDEIADRLMIDGLRSMARTDAVSFIALALRQAFAEGERAGMEAVENLIMSCEGDLDYALFGLRKLRDLRAAKETKA